MSHEPPVPPEATSPYPLQPPPVTRKAKRKASARPRKGKRDSNAAAATPGTALVVVETEGQDANHETAVKTTPLIGVGAAVALGAAAAVTGLFYAKRRSAAAANGKRPTQGTKRKGGDDKTKRTGGDRRRVAAGQPYEVAYFARKHGLSTEDARAIIKQAGNDRTKANQLAGQRKDARE
ncbi:DUF3606 domain-containing protein [Sphingomonas turrisvirgatae]|uniref:DUF3606 domain-containing protein n=1 Tax=Sphingomonas turrisvirgatae TaxID=1888892 RepID=UPI0009A24747|nr:DUF3606 domain-containing protein [Sphingomonas turrisvirgatae]